MDGEIASSNDDSLQVSSPLQSQRTLSHRDDPIEYLSRWQRCSVDMQDV